MDQIKRQTHVDINEVLMYVRFDNVPIGDSESATASLINQRIYLTDAAILRGCIIRGIAVFDSSVVGSSRSIPGASVAAFGLTIADERELYIERYPLGDLVPSNTHGKMRRFYCLCDPNLSYVERFSVPGSQAGTDVIPILFSYQKIK